MNNFEKWYNSLNERDSMRFDLFMNDAQTNAICSLNESCITCPLYIYGSNSKCVDRFPEWAHVEGEWIR